MPSNGTEHRKYKRYGVKGSAVQYKPDSFFSLFRSLSRKYIVLDMSTAGMQFVTKEEFKEGTHLQLQISAPHLYDQIIPVKGEVVWLRAAPELRINVVGVKFTSLALPDKSRLKSILDGAVLEKVHYAESIHLKKADKI
ncbi:MAG: PilZ domain-containing protein [Planctomycetes bacterium]|nr:PilZ domain-containing protein [Planctomycetota bacterium]